VKASHSLSKGSRERRFAGIFGFIQRGFMKGIFIFAIAMILSLSVFAQQPKTVLVSDIDDTLKVAYTFGVLSGTQYFRDNKMRFTGMSEVLNSLQKDETDLHIYYVSLAPEFLMKTTHLAFLKNGGFPEGPYFGRTSLSTAQHKLQTIRGILRQEKPLRVILIGDDAQFDAAVYKEISEDGEFAGTEFHQFIHRVSSLKDKTGQDKVASTQTAYLTSIELAMEMQKQGLMESSSVDFMMQNILPKILNERSYPDRGQVEFAFPYFQDCRALVWKWDIPGLNERVKLACRLP
jgi:hypothetical protein